MSGRRIVLHYHIFKNAGSSVDRFLRERYGESWAAFEGDHAADAVSEPRLRAFLDANPAVRAVSSHLARPPLPSGYRTVPIVFIRHPLDRLESVYEFCRIDPGQPNHERIAKWSLAEYTAWALDSTDGGVVVRDYQTIHLSDATFRAASVLDAVATGADLAQATEFLASIPAFGLVDRFDDSMARIRRAIGPEASDAPDGGEPGRYLENATRGVRLGLEERLGQMRERLGPALWRRAIEANELDLRLYEWATRRFLEIG